MIVYHSEARKKAILHFGLGLVGKSIFTKIKTKDEFEISSFPFTWDKSSAQSELQNIFDFIQKKKIDKTTILWSAGKCGFSSTEEQTAPELVLFDHTLDTINKFHGEVDMVLFSSGGGLYENQTNINLSSPIIPHRPYGFLKLKQEEVAKKYIEKTHILRLSSVYTETNFNARMGLISTLLKNGLEKKISTIFGSSHTLRDYISDVDIANYTISILDKDIAASTEILCRGKAHSILEIKQLIEKNIRSKLFCKYLYTTSNSGNITYLNNASPINFNSTGLNCSINRAIKNYYIKK